LLGFEHPLTPLREREARQPRLFSLWADVRDRGRRHRGLRHERTDVQPGRKAVRRKRRRRLLQRARSAGRLRPGRSRLPAISWRNLRRRVRRPAHYFRVQPGRQGVLRRRRHSLLSPRAVALVLVQSPRVHQVRRGQERRALQLAPKGGMLLRCLQVAGEAGAAIGCVSPAVLPAGSRVEMRP